ncbi:uncharacterized protein LOC103312960 [Tribolium castaneum]|nr:PREDICTED: uncharacterized protein LOC103312960 [Tribolium castaneum]|eukprot:XP_015835540.1 PREDICTED: uncharacterized protein LOC103312960 [Tribolium castaneum]
MPRYVGNLNQPQVASIAQMGEARSQTGTPWRALGGTVSSYYAEDSFAGDQSVVTRLFALSFRNLRNRNWFVQHVFVIVALQMLFSFVFYFVMVYKEGVMNSMVENWILLLVIFTAFVIVITSFMVCCSTWIRQKPMNLICLFVITVSVILQFGALASKFKFTMVLANHFGCLTVVCFMISLIASQKRWEIMSLNMCGFILILTLVVCGVVAFCLYFLCKDLFRWDFIVASTILTILCVTFMIFLMKKILKEQILNTSDFVFGAIVMYMSVTTPYVVKAVTILIRDRKPPEEPVAETS